MTIHTMGRLNAGWGICGFTSSLYALYNNRPSEQVRLAKGGGTPTMMLAEIKSFLKILQAEERNDMLAAITTFTRSFGGVFAGFTIDDYIARINDVVNTGADVTESRFGIAMPPECVVEYLKQIGGFNGSRIAPLSDKSSELILGVYDTNAAVGLHKGLKHYLYQLNGRIHSWGQEFDSVEAAMGAGWDVCYKITIAG